MDKEAIRRALPESASPAMTEWVWKNYPDELGREYLVWRAVRQRGTPTMEYLMDNGWHEGLSYWAAEVTCTDCGETFTTAGGGSSFWLACGEDGLSYTVEPEYGEAESDVFCDTIEITAGDSASCPYCQHMCEVIHAKALRGGRTKRIMTVAVSNVSGYAAILYWMIERNITEYGSTMEIKPMYAYVLGDRGGVTKYRHGQFTGMFGTFRNDSSWQLCKDNRDQIQCQYNDWGSINNRKAGAIVYPFPDSLIGTTGEKTGLHEMTTANKTPYLLDYVKLWYKWKPVEALAKAGFTDLLSALLDGDVYGNALTKLASVFDTGARKPSQILGLTKAEYREGMQTAPRFGSLTSWDLEDFRTFRKIREREPQVSPRQYIQHKRDFGRGLQQAIKLGGTAGQAAALPGKKGASRLGRRNAERHPANDTGNIQQAADSGGNVAPGSDPGTRCHSSDCSSHAEREKSRHVCGGLPGDQGSLWAAGMDGRGALPDSPAEQQRFGAGGRYPAALRRRLRSEAHRQNRNNLVCEALQAAGAAILYAEHQYADRLRNPAPRLRQRTPRGEQGTLPHNTTQGAGFL